MLRVQVPSTLQDHAAAALRCDRRPRRTDGMAWPPRVIDPSNRHQAAGRATAVDHGGTEAARDGRGPPASAWPRRTPLAEGQDRSARALSRHSLTGCQTSGRRGGVHTRRLAPSTFARRSHSDPLIFTIVSARSITRRPRGAVILTRPQGAVSRETCASSTHGSVRPRGGGSVEHAILAGNVSVRPARTRRR